MQNQPSSPHGGKKALALAAVLVLVLIGAGALYPRLSQQVQQPETTPRVEATQAPNAPETTPAPMVDEVTPAPEATAAPTVIEATPAPAANEATPTPRPVEAAGPVQRHMAADFTVYTDEGEAVTLRQMRGKPVVVNFFASWCGVCAQEMPDLEALYQTYGDQITFMVVDLCAFGNDTKDAAKRMIADGGYTFPVYFDTEGSAAVTYAVRAMPTTLFVAADGELIRTQVGMLGSQALTRQIESMLGK